MREEFLGVGDLLRAVGGAVFLGGGTGGRGFRVGSEAPN